MEFRYCPVCSEANGFHIEHNGPLCEPGKSAFAPSTAETEAAWEFFTRKAHKHE